MRFQYKAKGRHAAGKRRAEVVIDLPTESVAHLGDSTEDLISTIETLLKGDI